MEKEIKKDFKFYLKLFWATFSISAFTFGGGYIIVPLLQKKLVDDYGWLNKDDMLNYVAIGQSAPGAIAVNVSVMIGFSLAGLLGAFLTILGTILPPMIIITVISYFYEAFKDNSIFKAIMLGLSCGVAAVIIDAVIGMAKDVIKTKHVLSIIIMSVSLFLSIVLNINVMFILIGCVLLGVVLTLIEGRKKL